MKRSILKKCAVLICAIIIVFTSDAQKVRLINNLPFNQNSRVRNPNPNPPNKNYKFRRIDGTYNNITSSDKLEYGATEIKLAREIPAEYSDKLNSLAGATRPSTRLVSNELCDEPTTIFTDRNLSSFVYVWGQFLDHDITKTPTSTTESFPIKLPTNETLFTLDIPFTRSEVFAGTGITTPREQVNLVTAWIDASNVYGSDDQRALWLRTMKDGKMKTSKGNLLPYNTITGEYSGIIDSTAPSMANDKNKTVKTFVAGDVRAAEHPALTSMHVLFVREHNRICDRLKAEGGRSDEEMYQQARKEVGALIQVITYQEFLPALGVSLTTFTKYNPNVSPDILNTFATASYRIGHSMVADDILVLDNECEEVGQGEFDLLEVFWNPQLVYEYNIDPFIKGIASHQQYETDLKVNSILRNFLFGSPTAQVRFGLDLAAINIQRGRDHGLPNYNAARRFYNGKAATSFGEISTDITLTTKLRSLYGNINNIDLWVGLLAEDRLPGKSVGKTMHAMLKYQFEKLRDGDYYFYLNDPYISARLKDQLKRTKLSDVVKRNTSLTNIPTWVFYAEACPPTIQTADTRASQKTSSDISIAPNPFKESFVIKSVDAEKYCNVEIFSLQGSRLKSFQFETISREISLPMYDLQAGNYFVKIQTPTQSKTLKIIKMD
ncbi:MAG: T9SS type A sorting domain-containing protein [Saprospiraceae bacterium]|nr:T9SS type A sorting domain-containing protein [Saprospiraceae bacterium]